MDDRPELNLYRKSDESTYIRTSDLAALLDMCAKDMEARHEPEAGFVLRSVSNFVHSLDGASEGVKTTALDDRTLSAGLAVIRGQKD